MTRVSGESSTFTTFMHVIPSNIASSKPFLSDFDWPDYESVRYPANLTPYKSYLVISTPSKTVTVLKHCKYFMRKDPYSRAI